MAADVLVTCVATSRQGISNHDIDLGLSVSTPEGLTLLVSWLQYPRRIDMFHNNFSPSGKQSEHRKLAHEL